MGQRYRREIDGLRAVAVMSVVLSHAGLPGMSGGFVGVDVFFVISGFLITGILARELEQGRFSLVRFYKRRARRILPALFLVLAVSSVAAMTLLLPSETRDYSLSQLSVVLFGANILFYTQQGYFAASAALNPLLHTWSLAVEEQFYILFPVVLWLAWRWHPKVATVVVALGGAISFGLCLIIMNDMPSANFYLLPSRAWELVAGALLALHLRHRAQPEGAAADVVGWAGLAAIAVSVPAFHEGIPFPSHYTLLPVCGAVAIIWVARPARGVGLLLSWPPLVWIGLISYSLYLWHQPLFAFARLLTPGNAPPLWVMLGLTVVAVLWAWATYRWVETPFRRQGAFSRRTVFGWSAGASAAFAAVSALGIAMDGFPQRFPEAQRAWIATSPLDYGDYVRGAYREVNGAPLATDKPSLVIVGDSFSQDIYNVIHERGAFHDHTVSAIYVPARCQLHAGLPMAEVLANLPPEVRGACADEGLSAPEVDRIRDADVLVLAARWQDWSANRLPQTLAALGVTDAQKLVVVGAKSFEPDRRRLLDIAPEAAAAARFPVPSEVIETNRVLASAVPQGSFVDILGDVCQGGCPLFTPDGALISYDGLHLTREGAIYLGDALFATGPLAAFDK